MTLRKMSTKVLSVFLAVIMIVALWAPAVSAAGHDHAHKVEINYDETKVRDALNALIGQLLGDEAFYADYTVSEDSYYVAIGDDVAYATILAGKMGLGEDQFVTMNWENIDYDAIAKADLITIGYSEDMITGMVADVINDDAVVIDWATIVGADKAGYVSKVIDFAVDAAYAEKAGEDFDYGKLGDAWDYVADNYFFGYADLAEQYIDTVTDVVIKIVEACEDKASVSPAKETVKEVAEAYLYGYVSFAKNYVKLASKINAENPDAIVVLLSNYNTFAGVGLEVNIGEIVIDLGDYLTDGRKDAVNDYVNKFVDILLDAKSEFMGSDDVDEVAPDYSDLIPDGVEIPGDIEIPEENIKASLKEYINANLKDYIESFTKEDGAIDKEGLVKDIVNTHGSIGNYIEKIEEESGYTIEEWEDTLKEEIREEIKAEKGEDFDDEEFEKEFNTRFDEYKDEIDAAVKVKDTYNNAIKTYEDAIYNLVIDLIADAKKAQGIANEMKDLTGFDLATLAALAAKIDPSILEKIDLSEIIGETKAEKIIEIKNKLVKVIEDKLVELGWIEVNELEIPTLDLIYENLDKLDAKTREWIESFDRADVSKALLGLMYYSDKVVTLTDKGLEKFNAIYDEIADTEIVITGDSIDIGAVIAAPTSVLSLVCAGKYDNFIFVDISEVETGLNATGKAAIKAYIDDTTVAYATEAGSEYIAQQICDALGIVGGDTGCTHVDANKDHKCDLCGAAMGVHADANKDHNCDYGCSEKIGTHGDIDKDHNCDYGCSEKIGVCEDTDLDHKCDYGCSATFGEHVDADKDHKCDYGCSEKIGAHEDVEPVDHMCDYCGQRMSTHKYGKWETTKEATKKEEGEKVRTCTICGHKDIATIPCLEGLSTGAIIAIVIASILVVGGIGFAIYWFGYRKKMLFKKKATKTLSGK